MKSRSPSAHAHAATDRSVDTHHEPRFAQGHNRPLAITMPAGVLLVAALGYAGILAAMWVTFAGYPAASFMVAVSTFFAVMYAGVPLAMGAAARKQGALPHYKRLREFLEGDFETMTGRISGWETLVQVALVPVALAFGAMVIGFVIMAAR